MLRSLLPICLILISYALPSNAQSEERPSYMRDLEELGYCVIPNVLSRVEAEELYARVWHEYVEKAWPNCRLDDRSNWKETFPMHNELGIFTGAAGQTQVMWDLRQDPRIIAPFTNIWGTQDLIVSMDGLSLMCPVEIREGCIEPWPHVDQTFVKRQDGTTHNSLPPEDFLSESSLSTKPYTIQGQFLFEDSFEGDGGFYCIPKSHFKFTEFAPQLEALDLVGASSDARQQCLASFFDAEMDASGTPYCKKQITALY